MVCERIQLAGAGSVVYAATLAIESFSESDAAATAIIPPFISRVLSSSGVQAGAQNVTRITSIHRLHFDGQRWPFLRFQEYRCGSLHAHAHPHPHIHSPLRGSHPYRFQGLGRKVILAESNPQRQAKTYPTRFLRVSIPISQQQSYNDR